VPGPLRAGAGGCPLLRTIRTFIPFFLDSYIIVFYGFILTVHHPTKRRFQLGHYQTTREDLEEVE